MTQMPFLGEYVTEPELPTRALTLYQPYAWLVAHGHKPIENRPPGFVHKRFRGWFWIHAGAKPKLDQWLLAKAMCDQYGFTGLPAFSDVHALPLGAIIGRARIVGIVAPHPKEPVPWHLPDQYGFIVVDATPLKRPVECRGYQAFWHVPTAVLAALKEAA